MAKSQVAFQLASFADGSGNTRCRTGGELLGSTNVRAGIQVGWSTWESVWTHDQHGSFWGVQKDWEWFVGHSGSLQS